MGPSLRVRRVNHIKLPKDIKGPTQVKVGFPSGTSSDIVDRAIWNHYGTEVDGQPRVPARPFLLTAINKNQTKYMAALRTSASKIIRGETTLETVMRKLGALAQGDIQEEIRTMRDPPNAPATIRAKGSSNPLIDTGEMRQHVTWKVIR